MSGESPGLTLTGSVRERRFADTLAEIKSAALAQLATSGATKLALRAVARDVGMTVQSLYHYVDSYDALVTLLVLDSHEALADEIQRSARSTEGQPYADRVIAVTGAYREWAMRFPHQFLLIYGTPIPGYEAPESTRSAGWRQAAGFWEVVYGDWSATELAGVTAAPLAAADLADFAGPDDPAAGGSPEAARLLALPHGALRYFIELRATMHGLVMLELLHHLGPVPGGGAGLMRDFSLRATAELDRLRRSGSARVNR